jgi:uroporphyrinogen III methyltransferase/synthase
MIESSERPNPAVIVTRASESGTPFTSALADGGIRVVEFPVLEIRPPEDEAPFRDAIGRLSAGYYDWLVFTSANGVRAAAEALGGVHSPPAMIAAVGSSTARTIESLGWKVTLVPDTFSAEGLVRSFGDRASVRGARMLLPVAEAALATVPRGLTALGATVDVVVAYRSVPVEAEGVELLRLGIEAGDIHLVTFTSPSSAENFHDAVGELALTLPAAVLGPVTGETAERLGYRVVAVAEPHTIAGLVRAILHWAVRRSSSG